LIGSTLQDAGHDWHDLAGALVDPAAPRPKPQPSPRDARERAHLEAHDSDAVNWRQQREFCLEHRSLLRDREVDFITDLGRWRGPLTEKQASWLSSIYQRLRRTT
jgi:hypothetical protein